MNYYLHGKSKLYFYYKRKYQNQIEIVSLISIKALDMDDQKKVIVFNQLKKSLSDYSDNLHVESDLPHRYELYSSKQVQIHNNERKVMFASVVIQKKHIGLYFMPVYTHPDQIILDSQLQKLLKGKSCFHIKNLEEGILPRLEKLIASGFKLYQSLDWV